MPSENSKYSEAFATDSLLTVQEVAEMCKVPVSWVYERTRLSGSERIPCLKLGKYLRFEAAEVRNWLRRLREI